MENVLLFVILGLTFITALSQLFILILNSSKHKDIDHIDEEIDNLEISKSQQIIHDAQGTATRILANAELKGIEFLSRQKLDIQKIEEEYKKSIKELEKSLVEQFKVSLNNADGSYQGFLKVIEENLRQQELKNQEVFQAKTIKMIESTQNTMTNFVTGMNTKVAKEIDQELKAVRNELEMY